MRILAARAGSGADGAAIELAGAVVAAVTSITPADACTLATKHALRYAVQCWDVPEEGKAIFWRPSLALQGLYRTQFVNRDPQRATSPSGMLRVTFLWNGEPLNVLCAQLSAVQDEAEWQLMQFARELDAAQGPTLLAVDAAGFELPARPSLVDVWSAAPMRAIAYATGVDLGEATRAAFGLPASREAAGAAAAPARFPEPDAPVRLYCSSHFSVRQAEWRSSASGTGAVISADILLLGDVLAENPIGPQLDRPGSGARHDAIVR